MIMLEGRVAEICFTCKTEKPAVSHIFMSTLSTRESPSFTQRAKQGGFLKISQALNSYGLSLLYQSLRRAQKFCSKTPLKYQT